MEINYPQLRKLFEIYLAIPVSSSSAERAFSVLKRVKTWLRSTMEQDRTSALALLQIEKILLEEIDIEETILLFINKKDRRCKFLNLFFLYFLIYILILT